MVSLLLSIAMAQTPPSLAISSAEREDCQVREVDLLLAGAHKTQEAAFEQATELSERLDKDLNYFAHSRPNEYVRWHSFSDVTLANTYFFPDFTADLWVVVVGGAPKGDDVLKQKLSVVKKTVPDAYIKATRVKTCDVPSSE